MTHEIIIRGGNVVDGIGGEPVAGDVAIDNGMITEVGQISDRGDREFDAAGMIVAPGFIDMHTHLDAQIGWDRDLTPLSWHGVTTALMGNCGVTFAPCKPDDRPLLAGMMETVEDIPRESIMTGLPWDWEDYGGYLDSVDRLGPGINVAGMIGHAALRYFVMGQRAVEEQSTDAEREQMAAIVGEAIDRGAIGFSSNRYHAHKLPDGRAIPGTFADVRELEIIAMEVSKRNALFQSVGMNWDHMRQVADTAKPRMLFNSTLSGVRDDASGVQRRNAVEELSTGRDISGVAQVRGSGALMGLQALLPFRGKGWARLNKLAPEARLEAIRDADFRHQLIDEARAEKASWADPIWVHSLGNGESPDHSMGPHNNIVAMAKAAGEHWGETFLRLALESDGRVLFNYIGENQNLKALRDMFDGGRVFPGVGDAGAHVSMVMDAGWATFVLSHWVREEGLFTMGEGIRRMTSAPARILGLKDRGALKPGMRADITIFDAAKVAEGYPYRVTDFPGGAPRLTQKSIGYRGILVNGQFNVIDGELTGNHSGRVLRHVA
ncbi:MAG: amidohydrolase family protein [Proteobacteria bacterium]|jgi:N-acyl-D-amino-acid deacylase|nr:amidohydrolase family protein [Pseudomonadota bacterium]MDA1302176.1 amidohydrolase family protein [Pseudomonadota bacterium]